MNSKNFPFYKEGGEITSLKADHLIMKMFILAGRAVQSKDIITAW